MPTSGSPRSWNPQLARAMATAVNATALNDDIDEAAGNDHHPLRLLAAGEFLHRLGRHRRRGDLLAARRGRNVQVAAQLAVHLDYELDRILHQSGLVHGGPGLVDEARARAQFPPERGGDVRDNGREEQHRVLEHFLRDRARRGTAILDGLVEIQKLAYRRNGGVELQAPAVVVGHLLYRLVKLEAQRPELAGKLARCGPADHSRRDVFVHKGPEPAEKLERPGDALFGPDHRVRGRVRLHYVETRGVGAVLLDHVLR